MSQLFLKMSFYLVAGVILPSITFVSVIVIGGIVFLVSQVWQSRRSSAEYT